MRPIGFSTGALALGDFRAALSMLAPHPAQAVELSALREKELAPLMMALPDLDLSRFRHVSVHVPSKFSSLAETEVAAALEPCLKRRIPIVLHPDAIRETSPWRRFGALLCIENMDKRKPAGRTADELAPFFDSFPEASFCFDVAHARQIDPTMGEARSILRRFGSRLCQIHISELDTAGHHHPLSMATILATRRILPLIGDDVPVIIESQVHAADIAHEIAAVASALGPAHTDSVNWEGADWGALA